MRKPSAPALREAVQAEMDQLSELFPDYEFYAVFGGGYVCLLQLLETGDLVKNVHLRFLLRFRGN